MATDACIAVHGGAGMHSQKLETEIKRALKLACRQALGSSGTDAKNSISRKGSTVHLDMVENAIAILEDDVYLNAGYGSNLTFNGVVECDAAIMDGSSGDFGSVGAVSGIKNPIRLARSILEYSRIPDALGRIPPLLIDMLSFSKRSLVSEGARSFAVLHAPYIRTVTPESLKSERAETEWKKWKDRIENSNTTDTHNGGDSPGEMQDTVGAVSWHPERGMAAGVSSGGILLKYSGRIGEAAVFGAGCWAQQSPETKMGIACSVSGILKCGSIMTPIDKHGTGAGEHVTRAALARTIGENLASCISEGVDLEPHDILQEIITDKFWRQSPSGCIQRKFALIFSGPSKRRGVSQPEVGVLLLASNLDKEGYCHTRLWCAFTTPSMAIAYASLKNPKPKVVYTNV